MSEVCYSLEHICKTSGLEEEEVLHFVRLRIVIPKDEDKMLFDEEDLGRLKLISHLQEACEPNDESLEMMLYLIDQIHFLHRKLKP